MEDLSEIAKYAALVAVAIVLQLLLTFFVSKWMRQQSEKEREAIYKAIEPSLKFDRIVWRFFFWPLIALLAVWVSYPYFTDQL